MIEHERRSDVIIAGAGIAGLAVARALRRRSVASLVFERRRHGDDGLALNLPGNAIAALTALGLGDDLHRYGRPIGRREYRTDRGRLLFAVDEEAFWGSELAPRCVRRTDLLALLADGMPTETIRRNVSIDTIDEGPARVVAGLSDGSSVSGSLLVGADGVHSTTRRAIFGESAPQSARLATASWRFMIPNPGVDCWTLWAGRDALILLIPVDDSQAYGWAAATRDRSASPDFAQLASLTGHFPEPARRAVGDAASGLGSVHHSPLEEIRIDRWGSRRVVLVGDAAHATAPVWAEGAALAMEDALVLADIYCEKADADTAVAFEARRRARVGHVQAMTDRMSKAAELPAVVRNMLLPFVGPKSYRKTYGPLKSDRI